MQTHGSLRGRAALATPRSATLCAVVALAVAGCGSNGGGGDAASRFAAAGNEAASLGGAGAGSPSVAAAANSSSAGGARSLPELGGAGGSRAGAPSAGLSSNAGASASSSGAGAPSSGAGASSAPPAPMADGFSAYERECHGDTAMCVDVNALGCLGIRDDTTVYGYSCSNPCTTDADCSDAPSSTGARAACVDFVTQKHCLLVCASSGATEACPTGMSCYVYPGTTLGYCLWPP